MPRKMGTRKTRSYGRLGGSIPAMLNSMLGLRCLDYDANDPIIYRGLKP